MKFRQKNTTPAIDDAVSSSVNFEITVADLARRSERRAWFVALSAILMALILAGGYFLMLPLKEKVPYLVMADAYTGTSTVARLQPDFAHRSITTSTAINRSNVAHYILARESYDYALIYLRDWTTVYTMSTPDVASGYRALYSKLNPGNPFEVYGNSKSIRVKILSIVLLGGDDGTQPTGATVRFQRNLYDKTSGTSSLLESKIATLAFTYNDDLEMDEKHRIANPLGFQVTSYRVDNDYAEAPVLDPQMQPAPVQAPSAPGPGGQAPVASGSGAASDSDLPAAADRTRPAMPVPAPGNAIDGASNR